MGRAANVTIPVTCPRSGESCAKAAKLVVKFLHTPLGKHHLDDFSARFSRCHGDARAIRQAAANILDHTIALTRYQGSRMQDQARQAQVNLNHAVEVYDKTLERLKRTTARKKYTYKAKKRPVARYRAYTLDL